MSEVRGLRGLRWYDGHLFGGEVNYNPWSVLCFLDSSVSKARPHWLSASSNDLVKEILERNALWVRREI